MTKKEQNKWLKRVSEEIVNNEDYFNSFDISESPGNSLPNFELCESSYLSQDFVAVTKKIISVV